jgi:hypothetical protein
MSISSVENPRVGVFIRYFVHHTRPEDSIVMVETWPLASTIVSVEGVAGVVAASPDKVENTTLVIPETEAVAF